MFFVHSVYLRADSKRLTGVLDAGEILMIKVL